VNRVSYKLSPHLSSGFPLTVRLLEFSLRDIFQILLGIDTMFAQS